MLVEASMIPIDNSLVAQGVDFIRYVDDIIVFCKNEQDARLALSKIALTLDKQQRLILQRHKTQMFNAADFSSFCISRIEDRPINREEDSVLKLIDKYSHGDPYQTVFYGDISEEDWNSITDSVISDIIQDYLNKPNIDFDRLRWFYRRLTQIGHPGGIDITLENISKLAPCIAHVCMYLGSVQRIDPAKWASIGTQLISLLQTDLIKNDEYSRLLILSLFTRNQYIDHFDFLAKEYQHCEPFLRREILLSAKQNNANDWLREQKEGYTNMESWQQMAFIFSAAGFPREERRYFINRFRFERPLMDVLSKWAKGQ
jgi:hypothetical protein